MGILGKARKMVTIMIEVSIGMGQWRGEKKKIKNPKRRKLIESVSLTSEQRRLIDEFFSMAYGKKVPYDWHRLYQSYTGEFQEQYFPEILFSSKFELMVNPAAYRYVLDDKILLPLFHQGIENVRTPVTIATYSNGVYFDAWNEVKTEESFVKLLENCGPAIIKPTQDTSSGRGVRLVDFRDGSDVKSTESVREIVSSYHGSSFIVQEVIKPHEQLKALYPSAINTFRVVTYIWGGQVHHWPVTLRIGQGGSFLDNAHAGGMFISVTDEGRLSDKAFTEFQTVYQKHPDTGVVFDGYMLPFVPRLIRAAKKMHLNTPQLGVISWDLTVDENDTIILIETNTQGQTIWFPQMASGKPAFGENTEAVLKFISSK